MSFTRVTVVEGEPREPSWLWWVIVLVGVLSAVAGIILVFKPSDSLTTLAVIFGIFLLIDGIGELIASIAGTTDSRGLAAIIGVLGVIVGIALIRHPFHGVTAIGLLIGIWLVAAGIVRLVRSLRRRHAVPSSACSSRCSRCSSESRSCPTPTSVTRRSRS